MDDLPPKEHPTLETIPQDNIPELIEACIPLWRDELALLQRKHPEDRTKEDLLWTLQLSKVLNQAYVTYRILKAEIKREVRVIPPKQLLAMIEEYKPKVK